LKEHSKKNIQKCTNPFNNSPNENSTQEMNELPTTFESKEKEILETLFTYDIRPTDTVIDSTLSNLLAHWDGWTKKRLEMLERVSLILYVERTLSTVRYAEVQPSLNTLTEEEESIREAVSQYAQKKLQLKVREMDEKEKLDPEVLKDLFEQGFMGIETESEYGGSNSSFLAAILVVEELAKVDPSVSVICDVQNTLVSTLFRKYGNDYLKEKYLPRLVKDTVGCFCLSESEAGSDAFALKTRAEKKGDYYVIKGSKMWITNSAEADIFLVFANLDPSKKHKGITCFVIEKEMGVKVAKKESKVPESNVLGEIGKGYKYAIEILNEGRIGIAAQMIGLAQGAYDSALPYLFERKAFGNYIGEFQGMQHQFAQTARLLTYNAARIKQEGKNFVKEAAFAKLYSSQIAEKTASKSIEWMGGVGFTREFPGSIYEGTSNMQLTTIAKLISQEYKK
ncbi:5185_t:CDS:10, partial [Diversispora eburnea]